MAEPEIDRDASVDSSGDPTGATEEGDIYTDPKESGLRLGTGGGILYKLLIESR